MIFFSNILGAPCIFALIFISWKKGHKTYIRYSPYIFYGLLIFAYLLMPGVNVLLAIVLFFDDSMKYEERIPTCYIIFCFVMYSLRIIGFFLNIRPTILYDAKQYLANKDRHKGFTIE